MTPEAAVAILLRTAALGLVALAVLHVAFPRRFRWREDLADVSLLNRQLFHVHTLFVALTVAVFGILSWVAADSLAQPTPMLRAVLASMAVFWAVRLVVQLFVFDAKLWRGKPFEFTMHILFTVVWCCLTATYAWATWLVS